MEMKTLEDGIRHNLTISVLNGDSLKTSQPSVKKEFDDLSSSVSKPVKDATELLMPDFEKHQFSTNLIPNLAGQLWSVNSSTGTVLLRASCKEDGGRLLGVGTPVYLPTYNYETNYLEVGRILEVIGSVCEPIYLLQLGRKLRKVDEVLLATDEPLFYFTEHPDTAYVEVRRESDGSYTVSETKSIIDI